MPKGVYIRKVTEVTLKPENIYAKVHQYLRRRHGNAQKCEFCGEVGKEELKRWNIEWALKKGKVYSKNVDDYLHLCIKCHRKYDVTEQFRELIRQRLKGNTNKRKPVGQYLDGILIATFPSGTHAAIVMGVVPSTINSVLKKTDRKVKGFEWRRLTDYERLSDIISRMINEYPEFEGVLKEVVRRYEEKMA